MARRREKKRPARDADAVEARPREEPARDGGRAATPRKRTRGFLAILATLLIAGTAAAFVTGRHIYTTSDEPIHIAAARALLQPETKPSNFEHPVGMKLLAAAGLQVQPRDRLLDDTRDARRYFPLTLGLLAAAAAWWTAARSSAPVALAVGALVIVDPSLRGHASVVQSDLLVTALLVAAAAALDRAFLRGARNLPLLLAGGVAYGLALATKFSAAPFLPLFLLAALARARMARRRLREKRGKPVAAPLAARDVFGGLAVFASVALAALLLIQQLAFARTPIRVLKSSMLRQLASWNAPGTPATRRFLEAAPRGASTYTAGLLLVKTSSAPGTRFNYLFGRVSGDGFRLYFPVAIAVKAPTAVALGGLAILGLAASALGRASPLRRRRLAAALAARSLFPALLATLFLGAAAFSHANIGVRHAFPAYVFLLVAGAGAVTTLLPPFRWPSPRGRARDAFLAVVVIASAAEAAARWGREISFGNLLVGGPGGVHRVLSDSNVDWGQAQGRLFARVERGDLGRVGLTALQMDEGEGKRHDLVWLDRPDDSLDTVFFSVHLYDIGRAVARTTEKYPKLEWLRGWLVPTIDSVEARQVSVEPFGDEYLLFRLRKAPGPTPAP